MAASGRRRKPEHPALYPDAFGSEAVGVAGAVTLEQAVALEFASVVAELAFAVGGITRSAPRNASPVPEPKRTAKPINGIGK